MEVIINRANGIAERNIKTDLSHVFNVAEEKSSLTPRINFVGLFSVNNYKFQDKSPPD